MSRSLFGNTNFCLVFPSYLSLLPWDRLMFLETTLWREYLLYSRISSILYFSRASLCWNFVCIETVLVILKENMWDVNSCRSKISCMHKMCNLPVKTFVYETCWFHKIFSQVAHGTDVIGTPSSSPQNLGDFYWRIWKQSRSYDRIQRISEMPLNFRFARFWKDARFT